MKFNLFVSVLIFATLSFMGMGCKPDTVSTKELTVQDFHGNWKIFQASRNGNVTKSLENAFFEFRADNSVITNIFGSVDSFNFSYENKAFDISSPSPLSLRVQEMKNDTLVFNTEISVFALELYLKKDNE